MSLTSSVFSILLLSGDSDIQSQFKHVFKDASVICGEIRVHTTEGRDASHV